VFDPTKFKAPGKRLEILPDNFQIFQSIGMNQHQRLMFSFSDGGAEEIEFLPWVVST